MEYGALVMMASWKSSILMNIQGLGGLQQICLLLKDYLLAVTDGEEVHRTSVESLSISGSQCPLVLL